MSFTVRNAGVDDAEAVAAVHAASLQAAWRPLIPERVAHLVLDPPGFRPDGGKRVFLEHAGVSLHELRYRRPTPPAAPDSARRRRAA